MTGEHELELRDLWSRFKSNTRISFEPSEQFVVLTRLAGTTTPSFARFSDAVTFARGVLHAPQITDGCAFVLDTDPQFADATLVTREGPGSTLSLKEEIKDLYGGVIDGTNYAERLIEQRDKESNAAYVRAASDKNTEGQLVFFAVIAVAVVLYFLFR